MLYIMVSAQRESVCENAAGNLYLDSRAREGGLEQWARRLKRHSRHVGKHLQTPTWESTWYFQGTE